MGPSRVALKVFPTGKQSEVLLINMRKWPDGASVHPFPFLLNLTIILIQESSERNVGGNRAWKLRAGLQSRTARVQAARLPGFHGGWSRPVEWWCAPRWKPVRNSLKDPNFYFFLPLPPPLPLRSPPTLSVRVLGRVFGSIEYPYTVSYFPIDKHLAKQGRKDVFQLTATVRHSGSHVAGARVVWCLHTHGG